MKREVKFNEAVLLSVSLAYRSIGAVVMRKICLNPAYQVAYEKNDIISIMVIAEFCSMGHTVGRSVGCDPRCKNLTINYFYSSPSRPSKNKNYLEK